MVCHSTVYHCVHMRAKSCVIQQCGVVEQRLLEMALVALSNYDARLAWALVALVTQVAWALLPPGEVAHWAEVE